MKKLETGNIETGNTSTLATFNKMFARVVAGRNGAEKEYEWIRLPDM